MKTQHKLSLIIGMIFLLISTLSAGIGDLDNYKVFASNGESYSSFGAKDGVAIDGDYAIVAADYAKVNDNSVAGSAYIYHWDGSAWNEEAILTASNGGADNHFGKSVAIEGDIVVIGATGTYTADMKGMAYVFKRSGTTWTEEVILMASDGTNRDAFGTDVSILGNEIIVSANDANNYAGAVYSFIYDGTDWNENQIISPTSTSGFKQFGKSIAFDSTTLLVGCIDDSFSGFRMPGAVYAFAKEGGLWVQKTRILPDDNTVRQSFGMSVALYNNIAVISDVDTTPEKVYIFNKTDETTWTQIDTLKSGSTNHDMFGYDLAIDDEHIFVGSMEDSEAAYEAGAVFIYKFDGSNWNLDEKLLPPNSDSMGDFGSGLAVKDGHYIIGAKSTTGNRSSTGAAYIYMAVASEPSIITSTTTGGNWSETSTWVGGVVPTAADDVVITGTTVFADNRDIECKNLTIETDGYCYASASAIIKIHENFINKSSISANNNMFDIRVEGDIISESSAQWGTGFYITMDGSSQQRFTINNFASFYGFNASIVLKSEISGSSYQWYKDGVALTTQPGFGFATSQELRISDIDDYKQVGEYKCVVDGVDSRIITITSGSETPSTSTLNGKVTNAVDGTPISGALVAIGSLTTTTDADGNYEITDIPPATLNADFFGTPLSGDAPLEVMFTDQSNDAAHTLVISASGFSTYTNNQVVIAEGETLSMDASLSPTLATGEMRIVLNWGSTPNDIDSYLRTPTIDGSEYTVYYSNKGSATSAPYAILDIDDMSGYGPETITIYQRYAGTYYYYVHNYSGSPDISTSNGVVQVYTNDGLVSSVNIPTTGTGLYWNVLTIDGATGAVSVINTIDDSPAIPTAPPLMPEKINNSVELANLALGTEEFTNWAWTFGDGGSSTEQNPTHTYTVPGTYTVTLVASNDSDNVTEVKTDYITVTGGSTGGAIVSTTTGGWWHETTTWIGGVLPTATDDVIIDGTVKVNNPWPIPVNNVCKNLTINSGDSLYGDELGNYAALVECKGNLVNNGTISQNGTYNDFIISVMGNITNNGTFANKTIWMQSENAQSITSTNELEILIIEMKKGQNLIAGSDLSFIDTYFQFNHGEFIIGDGRTVSFYSMEGGFGHVDKAHIKGGGTIFSGGFNSTANVYYFNDSTTVENITLTGNIRGKGDFAILENVVNDDTLQQAEHNYPVTIKIEEDFTNDGVVRDNPLDNDHLEVKIIKNAVNNGIWNNSWIVMDGTSDQVFENKGTLYSGLQLNANVSSASTYQWFKDGVAIDGATEDNYKYYRPYDSEENETDSYGEYYCQTNAANSRTISIIHDGSGEGDVILTENFDLETFPTNGWTQTIVNTANTWKKGNPESNNFTEVDLSSVYSALCPWVAADQDEWLNSPVVALPDDEILLEFYAGYGTDWLAYATMKLHISVDGGTSWTQVWEAINDGNGWQWRKISVDLSDYKNNTNVMLGWQYVGNDGDLVGIDNVELSYGTVGVEQTNAEIPTEFALNQNYPNPFNPSTIISYALPKQEFVTLSIYNILGQKVATLVNEEQSAGNYQFNFDASNLSTGTYIYQIKSGSFVQSKKMLLIK